MKLTIIEKPENHWKDIKCKKGNQIIYLDLHVAIATEDEDNKYKKIFESLEVGDVIEMDDDAQLYSQKIVYIPQFNEWRKE